MGKLLHHTEEKIIVDAIRNAEKNTSGEIRVHFEKICKKDPYQRATEVFNQLEMFNTESRNGVLIYIAEESHHFAIIGDTGIHQKVGSDFWNKSRDIMIEYFKKGDFVHGIEATILFCGQALKEYFPYQKDDTNELSNEISYE
ncbi:MAG: TPM domain-containing protein [Bacteroidia bacterium]|nr:TPM domain-containing protein [Bacteroidia bacterium]MCZ2247571.1 TPM domain-containing protein [Bacteroidia bacterium]